MLKSPETRTRVRRATTRAAVALGGAGAAFLPVALAPGSHTQTASSGHEIVLGNNDEQALQGAKHIMLGSNVVALTSFVESPSEPRDAQHVTVAAAPKPAAPKPETYTVREGDSPWSIVAHIESYSSNPKNFIIFLDKFLRDNHLNPAWEPIHAGQIVKIPSPAEPTAPAVPLSPPQPVVVANHSATSSYSGSYRNTQPTYHANYSAPAPQTYTAGTSGFEACVIQRESGGNPNARNGQFWGTYQFGQAAWDQAGGNPADFGSASAAEQQQVFHQAMAKGMEYAWTPFDGCRR